MSYASAYARFRLGLIARVPSEGLTPIRVAEELFAHRDAHALEEGARVASTDEINRYVEAGNEWTKVKK